MTAKHRNKERILEYLAAKPATRAELSEKLSLAFNTTWRWVMRLHTSSPKLVHISGWVRAADGDGQPTPIFSVGNKPDARCRIKVPTKRERDTARRKLMRQDGRAEDRNAAARAKYWASKQPQRDPLTAALFGAGQTLDT